MTTAGGYGSAVSSLIGSGMQIAGTVQGIKALQDQTKAQINSMEEDVNALVAASGPTLYSPELTTPASGLFLPQPGSLVREESGPSYGWIAPVVLGVFGLGILAWILTKKR